MRKIIQIAISECDRSVTKLALCDDGTVWQYQTLDAPAYWFQLPPIPQQGEERMNAKTTTNLGPAIEVTFDGSHFKLKDGHDCIYLSLEDAKELLDYLQAHTLLKEE